MADLQAAYNELVTIAALIYGDSFTKAPIPKRDNESMNPDGRSMRKMEREGKEEISKALNKCGWLFLGA